MNAQPIVISLSPEVQEVLADNQIDLVHELQELYPQEEFKTDYSTPLGSPDGKGQEKSVALIILASAAAFYLVSQGIEKIVNSLGNNKRVVVKQQKNSPGGNDGTTTLLEPKVEEKNKSKISFLGLAVEFENERKQG